MEETKTEHGHVDLNNPLSLYSKMGSHWAKRFQERMEDAPELMELLTQESVLKERLIKHYKFRPNPDDNRYRLQLWLEYENACKMNRPMQMSNVYNLVGPEATFHKQIMKDVRRVAWLLCRPATYKASQMEILSCGIHRLRSYLDIDALTAGKKGGIDHRLMKLQLEITRMADLRLHGAPTQKIQEISLKATIGANGEIQEAVEAADMKALLERKQDLEVRRRIAEGRAGAAAAPPIDAELVKDEGVEVQEVAGDEGAPGGERGGEGEVVRGDGEGEMSSKEEVSG